MLRQILIAYYSNVPYVSDVMVTYNNITQDHESTPQYLIRAKVLLEHINHIFKLSQISSKGLNNLGLVLGLRDNHIRRRVTKEQESRNTMEDIYRSINRITKNEVRTKAYQGLRYDSVD